LKDHQNLGGLFICYRTKAHVEERIREAIEKIVTLDGLEIEI